MPDDSATAASRPAGEILRLLAAARAVTGLRVILRDLSGRSGLDGEFAYHLGPDCQAAKAGAGIRRCIAFCAGSVLRDLAGDGQPRIHACPAGRTEIAVPVLAGDTLLGVVYAGVDGGRRPAAGWLADRQALLEAVAARIAGLLDGGTVAGADLQSRILACIERGLPGRVPLTLVARQVGLSPSRCGHRVKDLFGITFPALVRRARMQAAARLLQQGGVGVAQVAARVGCCDRDWFARQFRREHGCSPAAFVRRRSV